MKTFHVFVANRITTIHQLTSPNQWKYVPSTENPADCLTRGLRAEGLCSDKWLQGPAFLRSYQEFKHETKPLCDEDPEVKTEKGIPVLKVETNPIDKLIEHSSRWYRLKRLVAWLILIKDKLKAKDKDDVDRRITVKLLNRAEHVILQHVQCTFLKEEYNSLKGSSQVKKSSSIYKLSPILINKLICVGGRLQTSNIPDFEKHQIIIPKDSRLNELAVRVVHEKGHTGTEHKLARVRKKDWLIKGRVKIRNYISKCVICKKLYGKVSQQKMAPLPSDHLPTLEPIVLAEKQSRDGHAYLHV